MNKRKNGFTLIELIAVLVILAIIALIVTPLVMNIVKKAKDSSNKRSVDAYGKAVELAVATHLLDYGEYPTSLDNLTVEYTGNEVVCNIKTLNEDGSIYLSECLVNGTEVKDSSTEDGYYHYGKTSALVYQSYVIGDVVTYNGMNFYVIADSDETQDYVTLLKSEPLTVDEVNTYGTDSNGINHVNSYTGTSVGTAYNFNNYNYGGMQYYTSQYCGYTDESGCLNENATSYETSDVKYVVDGWTVDKINSSVLKEDSFGYKARLITIEELTDSLGYDFQYANTSGYPIINDAVPSWVYNSQYTYWTMSSYKDDSISMWQVGASGLTSGYVNAGSIGVVIRPVINLKKSAI